MCVCCSRWTFAGEYVGKEMVVAKRVACAIQRYDKEVASLQAIQQRGAVALAGYGIAERAAQAVENRGLEQKRADAFPAAAAELLQPDSP